MVEVKFVLLNNEEFEPIFKEFRLFAKEHPDKISIETVALAKSKYLNLIVTELAVSNEYLSLVDGLKAILAEVKKPAIVVEKAVKPIQRPVGRPAKPQVEEEPEEELEEDDSEPEEMDL